MHSFTGIGRVYISKVAIHQDSLTSLSCCMKNLKKSCLRPTFTINSRKISTTLAFQFSVGLCEADPECLQVFRVPEDLPVPEPASEPHDEAQRHPAVHLHRVWHGIHPVAPPETAHAHS